MKIENFVRLMTGRFDNKEQFTEMKEDGKIFPYAQHVNTVCNDKIKNLKSNITDTGVLSAGNLFYQFNPALKMLLSFYRPLFYNFFIK